MSKPLLGLLLGAGLGALDGLTSLFYPEVKSQLFMIIVGSMGKGLLAGLIIGWLAKRFTSLPIALLSGLAIAALITFPIAIGKNPETGRVYFWEIMIPGAMVGLIVGYATLKFGRPASARA
jgi:uncharacterized membrane protein (Fun14 family)